MILALWDRPKATGPKSSCTSTRAFITRLTTIEIEIRALQNLIEIPHRVERLGRSCRDKLEDAIALPPKRACIALVVNDRNGHIISPDLETLILQRNRLIEGVKQADHGGPIGKCKQPMGHAESPPRGQRGLQIKSKKPLSKKPVDLLRANARDANKNRQSTEPCLFKVSPSTDRWWQLTFSLTA